MFQQKVAFVSSVVDLLAKTLESFSKGLPHKSFGVKFGFDFSCMDKSWIKLTRIFSLIKPWRIISVRIWSINFSIEHEVCWQNSYFILQSQLKQANHICVLVDRYKIFIHVCKKVRKSFLFRSMISIRFILYCWLTFFPTLENSWMKQFCGLESCLLSCLHNTMQKKHRKDAH